VNTKIANKKLSGTKQKMIVMRHTTRQKQDVKNTETNNMAEKTTQLPDHIAITWHIEDVKSADEQREDQTVPPLTDEQCREVLQAVKAHHDATIGVNWEVIAFWIDQVRESITIG
jgi:hypothetical protein